jgi:RimJ/RimL family protein N-acetyltransferase
VLIAQPAYVAPPTATAARELRRGILGTVPDSWGLDDALGYATGVLDGEHVRLRELHEADLPQLEVWLRDPSILIFDTDTVRPRPEGAPTELLRRWSANDTPASVGFSIVTRDEGTLVGHVGLFNIDPKDRNAEVNILLGPPHQGRGYGTDAMRVLVRYGFLELGLHRIELGVFAFNERALAAYSKAGFVVEGRRRQRVFHGGSFHDDLIMGILRPEWERGQERATRASGAAAGA